MYKNHLLLLLVFIFLANCKSQVNNTLEPANEKNMILVLQENYSGFKEEQLIAIEDQKSLQKVYSVINRTRKPGLELPNVDFEKEMLIVWCGGETSKTIPKLDLKITKEEIRIEKRYSNSNKKKESRIINPIQIYRVAKSTKNLILQ